MEMMRPVHEMEKDRASGMSKLVRINPTVCKGWKSENGAPAQAWWQNGRWFTPFGSVIEDPVRDIPEDVRLSVEQNPPTVQTEAPEVTKVCKFCKEEMNSSQYDEHLHKHIENMMYAQKPVEASVATMETPKPEPIGDPPVAKPKRTMSAEQKEKMAAGRARAKAAKAAEPSV